MRRRGGLIRLRALALSGVLIVAAIAVHDRASASHDGNVTEACPAGLPEDGFTDVPESNVHELALDCVVWYRLTAGVTATTYAPGADVRRDQMASFIARLLERAGYAFPTSPPDAFEDDTGNAHESRINQLAAVGIVTGKAPGRYRPADVVTRAQMATFLVRAVESLATALATGIDSFPDDRGDPHESNIDKAAAAGLVAGRSDGTYGPGVGVRRDQMASFLARVLDHLVENGVMAAPRPGVLDLDFLGPLAAETNAEVVYTGWASGGAGPPYEWVVRVDGEEDVRTTLTALRMTTTYFDAGLYELCLTATDAAGASVTRCRSTGVARPPADALPAADDLAAVGPYTLHTTEDIDAPAAAGLITSSADASSLFAGSLDRLGWSGGAVSRFSGAPGEDLSVLVGALPDEMAAAEAVQAAWGAEHGVRRLGDGPDPTALDPEIGQSSIAWCDDGGRCAALYASGRAFGAVIRTNGGPGGTAGRAAAADGPAEPDPDLELVAEVARRAVDRADANGFGNVAQLPEPPEDEQPFDNRTTVPFSLIGQPRDPLTKPCETTLPWLHQIDPWATWAATSPNALEVEWHPDGRAKVSFAGTYQDGEVGTNPFLNIDHVQTCSIGRFAGAGSLPAWSHDSVWLMDYQIEAEGTWSPSALGGGVSLYGTIELALNHLVYEDCLETTVDGTGIDTVCPPAIQGATSSYPIHITSSRPGAFTMRAVYHGFNPDDAIYLGEFNCQQCFRS